MAEQKTQQIKIRAQDADLKGVYSNVMKVSHNQEEFILDFFNIVDSVGVLSSRIILSPGHLKRMIAALEDNLKKYEDRFGLITPSQAPTETGQIGFKPE